MRFIDDTQKHSSVAPAVKLRELPQEAAENSGEILEQKDEEVAAAALAEPLRAPERQDDRPGRHVRFADEVTIISLTQAASTRGFLPIPRKAAKESVLATSSDSDANPVFSLD